MTDVHPTFAEFKRLAGRGNVIPVYRTVVADLLSPVSAFLKLAPQAGGVDQHPYSFLLESVEGGERVGRYTFFGVDPFQVISCRGDRITLTRGKRKTEETGNIWLAVDGGIETGLDPLELASRLAELLVAGESAATPRNALLEGVRRLTVRGRV